MEPNIPEGLAAPLEEEIKKGLAAPLEAKMKEIIAGLEQHLMLYGEFPPDVPMDPRAAQEFEARAAEAQQRAGRFYRGRAEWCGWTWCIDDDKTGEAIMDLGYDRVLPEPTVRIPLHELEEAIWDDAGERWMVPDTDPVGNAAAIAAAYQAAGMKLPSADDAEFGSDSVFYEQGSFGVRRLSPAKLAVRFGIPVEGTVRQLRAIITVCQVRLAELEAELKAELEKV